MSAEFHSQLQPLIDDWPETPYFDLSPAWFLLLQNPAIFPQVNPLYLQHAGIILALQQKIPRQLHSLTNFYSAVYAPVFTVETRAEHWQQLIQALRQRYPCDLLRFDAMDPLQDSFVWLERALEQNGFKACRFFCFNNWYLPVNGRNYQTYFEGLSSRVKNTVKRRSKTFFAEGKGRIELISSPDQIEQYSEIWTQIYNRSWKVPEPYPLFMPNLIKTCAEQGWLRLGVAWYQQQPVAAQLWIVYRGTASIYKLAYDEQFAALSPGTVLTAYLMQYVLDVDRVQQVDYLVGDDAYKRDWMSHCRQRWGMVAYNTRSLRGLLGYSLQWLGQWRRKWLKHGYTGTPTDSKTG